MTRFGVNTAQNFRTSSKSKWESDRTSGWTRKTLNTNIEAHVERGSRLFTDALESYESLSEKYLHETVDHAVAYVKDDCHTNGVENFWSLVKRGLKGTYVSVMPWHLFRYVDE